MFLYLFFSFIYFRDTLTSNNIPFSVMSRFIFSTGISAISLLYLNQIQARAVGRLLNILLYSLVYDWMVNDE